MQDAANELRRIPLPRTRLNRGEEEGPGHLPRHLYRSSLAVPSACSTHASPRRIPLPRTPVNKAKKAEAATPQSLGLGVC